MTILLDSFALIELLAGSRKGKAVLELAKKSDSVLTTTLNLYELWYGIAGQASGEKADESVKQVKNICEVIPADEEICLLAARIKAKHLGKGIGAVDFITGAAAKTRNAVLVTGDPHFKELTEIRKEML